MFAASFTDGSRRETVLWMLDCGHLGGVRGDGGVVRLDQVCEQPRNCVGILRIGVGVPARPNLDTTSDCKHQSASGKHGHQVGYITRRVHGGIELRTL